MTVKQSTAVRVGISQNVAVFIFLTITFARYTKIKDIHKQTENNNKKEIAILQDFLSNELFSSNEYPQYMLV